MIKVTKCPVCGSENIYMHTKEVQSQEVEATLTEKQFYFCPDCDNYLERFVVFKQECEFWNW